MNLCDFKSLIGGKQKHDPDEAFFAVELICRGSGNNNSFLHVACELFLYCEKRVSSFVLYLVNRPCNLLYTVYFFGFILWYETEGSTKAPTASKCIRDSDVLDILRDETECTGQWHLCIVADWQLHHNILYQNFEYLSFNRHIWIQGIFCIWQQSVSNFYSNSEDNQETLGLLVLG